MVQLNIIFIVQLVVWLVVVRHTQPLFRW